MSLPQRVQNSEDTAEFTFVPDNPYLLLTPGPLSTAKSVRAAMLRDWCTWDEDYNSLVQDLRRRLVRLATPSRGYTAVLMQGSGTFGVEAVIGSVLPRDGKLLVLANGAYGQRMVEIARRLRIPTVVHDNGELLPPDLARLGQTLADDPGITHVAAVHCETTTGILNPAESVGRIVKEFGRVFILDAMSSFGGLPMDVAALGVDFLVTSANKCLQGVPGFSVIIARQAELLRCKGWARSLSLDLFDQWHEMETHEGKWRFTSPTHTVHAFAQAIAELAAEGGITARYLRYCQNHTVLVAGMRRLGFQCLLPEELQSPFITTFLSPAESGYDFRRFYHALKARGFVIYPGKVTTADTFRIGTIGDVIPEDIHRLIGTVEASIFWR